MSSTIHGLRLVASSQIAGALRGLKAMIAGTRQLRQQWKTAAKDVGSSAAKITMVIGAIGLISATTFGKFEQTMTRVGAVTRTLGTRDFLALEKAAQRAGETTVFSAQESADAMEKLGLAGLKTNEVITALPGTLQLASAAQLSIAESADISAKLMRAFGLEAQEMTRINDALIATSNNANTDVRQLGEAFKPVAPLARALGVSIEDTASILGRLADQGFVASEGGTALRNILSKLAGATPEVTNKLRALGIETMDASGNMRPLFDVLQDIEAAGLSGGKVMELFGMRGGPQMNSLLAVGTAELRRFSGEIQSMSGVAAELERESLKTLSSQFKLLLSAIESIQNEVGKRLKPELVGAMNEMRAFIKENRADIVRNLSDAVIGLVGGVRNLFAWLRKSSPQLQEAYETMKKFMVPVIEFIVNNPKLLAALLALKASATLGVTQAIMSLGSALIGTGNAMISLSQSSALAGTAFGKMLTASNLLKGGLFALGLALIALGSKYIYDLVADTEKWNEETEKAIRLNNELKRLTDKRFNRKLNNVLSIQDPTARIEKLNELMGETNNKAASYEKQIAAAQKRVDRLNTTWNSLINHGILANAKEELAELKKGLDDVKQTKEDISGHIGDARFQIEHKTSGESTAGEERIRREMDELNQQFQMPGDAELKQDEIANILRDAQRDKKDQETPGFSKIRDFIDLGPTQEQFREFLGTIEGITPELQNATANMFERLRAEGRLNDEVMDQLAMRAAERANQLITKEQEKQQYQDQVYNAIDKSIGTLGQTLMGLKGEIPNEQFVGLATKFINLRQQLENGQIGLSQYEKSIAALTKETQKAADAAKAAAAAEERKRLLQGKFTKKEFQTALEDRIIAFRQQQFSNAVERSFNALFGFNQQMGTAADGFRSLTSGMSGFGDRISSIGSGITQNVEQQLGTLRSFYQSAQGQAANIRNQIEQLRQNMTLVDTYSARQRIQEMIDGLFNQLNNIVQTPPPTFSGVTGANFFKDPGLQSVENQNNKFELNFPNINKLTNNDINEIYDMMEQEKQRRGGSFSV